MELNEFIEKFAEQFDETDPSLITPDTNFWELPEWSSVIALSLVSMCDEEYDVTIKSADVKNVKTVRDLFEVVKAKADK